MTSNRLLARIETWAARHGVAFDTGRAAAVNGRLGDSTHLLAEPPVLKKREGTSEGLLTWSVTLRIVTLPDRASGTPESVARLENTLQELCTSLAGEDDAAGMPEISFTPEEGTLTNRGEISLKAVLTVKTRF